MPRLVIRTMDGPRSEHELDQEVVLGRGVQSSLQIDDTKLSRRHARIAPDVGSWFVEDLGSSNGTYVNGEPCKKLTLAHGDKIAIGHTVVLFKARIEPERAPIQTARRPRRDDLHSTRRASGRRRRRM